MRIIIDGCDKSGKSTLIEALKNEIPSLIGVKLLTKPKDNSPESKQYIQLMYAKMAEMTRDQSCHYLFDRYYPSQMVYSFKRGHDDMKDGWFWKFEKELTKTPSLYILLNVDKKLLLERFKTDGEDYAKPEEIDRIQKRYLKHFKQCQLNKMVLDPTDDLPAAVAKIKEAMAQILAINTTDFTTIQLPEVDVDEDEESNAKNRDGAGTRSDSDKSTDSGNGRGSDPK